MGGVCKRSQDKRKSPHARTLAARAFMSQLPLSPALRMMLHQSSSWRDCKSVQVLLPCSLSPPQESSRYCADISGSDNCLSRTH
eukprot:2497984-Amphidinium_carterae.1